MLLDHYIKHINQDKEITAVSALNADNLKHVTKKITSIHSQTPIIIGADNDLHNLANPNIKSNIGVEKAKEAARFREDIIVLVPPSENISKEMDWNDFLLDHGLDKTAQEILKQVNQQLSHNLIIEKKTENKEVCIEHEIN